MDVAKCKILLDVRSQNSEKLQVVTPDPKKDKSLAIFQRETNHTKTPKTVHKLPQKYVPHRLVQLHTNTIATYIPYEFVQLHTNQS